MSKLHDGSPGKTRACDPSLPRSDAYDGSICSKTIPPFCASEVWHVPTPLAHVGFRIFAWIVSNVGGSYCGRQLESITTQAGSPGESSDGEQERTSSAEAIKNGLGGTARA